MKHEDIRCFALINDVDSSRVEELVESMLSGGWKGCPILVCGESLITGSHRLAALNRIYDMVMNLEIDEAEVLETEIAEDVTEIVEDYLTRTGKEIEYDRLGDIFVGTWVEEYKNEIVEW